MAAAAAVRLASSGGAINQLNIIHETGVVPYGVARHQTKHRRAKQMLTDWRHKKYWSVKKEAWENRMVETLIRTHAQLVDLMNANDEVTEQDIVSAINELLLTAPNIISWRDLRHSLLEPDFTGYSSSRTEVTPYSICVFEQNPRGKGVILDADGFAIWKSEKPFDPDKGVKLFKFDKKYFPDDMDLHNSVHRPIHYLLENLDGEYAGNWTAASGNGYAFMKRSEGVDYTTNAMFIRFYLEGLRRLK